MCAAPDIKPLPERNTGKAIDAGAAMRRVQETLRKKMGFAGSVKTPAGGLGAATTTGKTLLGA